jgi:hypothetical protein
MPFQLRQHNPGSGRVGYGLDGFYVLRSREITITISTGRIVALEDVVLHSLRIGICRFSDGHRDVLFEKDIPLKETRIAAGGSYNLDGKSVSIPLVGDLPGSNCLCSVFSGSGGDAFAEGQRPVSVTADQPPGETGEFWKQATPDHWSETELQDFLTNSPWAHTVLTEVLSDAGFNGHPSSMGLHKHFVRWESAALMRDALSITASREYSDSLASLSKDYYIIAIVTLLNRQREVREEGQLKEVKSNRFIRASLLKRGGESMECTRIESGDISQGWVFLYLFPRALALENGNGDLDFVGYIPAANTGDRVQARFSLKDLAQGVKQGL